MLFDKTQRNIRRTRKIFKTLTLPLKGKVVDVSCGGGRLLKTIENSNPDLELYGVDIEPGYLALHQELSNIKFLTAEASSLPFESAFADTTICALSLHHYSSPRSVISEIIRITKPGGSIYLIDISPKNHWSQYLYNLIGCNEPYHFEKFYTAGQIKKLFEGSKFEPKMSHKISALPRITSYEIRGL